MSISFINRKSGGGGDGSSLNVFTQLAEPAIKKGIWLKKEAEPEHYTYDEEIFIGGQWVADGTFTNIPFDFSNCYVRNNWFKCLFILQY